MGDVYMNIAVVHSNATTMRFSSFAVDVEDILDRLGVINREHFS